MLCTLLMATRVGKALHELSMLYNIAMEFNKFELLCNRHH